MLVTQQPVLKRFWYPVMLMDHLQNGPKPFELLGQKIVVWLTADNQPAAAADRCCHRSAQLSKGQVLDGNIRCPYHGWSFNAAGNCVKVPQLAEDQLIPRTYRVPAYNCTERYGYVWVCLDQPLQPIMELPEADDPQFRQMHEFYEPWDCSGLRVMENSFDNAHFSFVHTGTFGNQQQPIPASLEYFDHQQGINVKTKVPVVNPALQQKNLGISEGTTLRTNDMTWFMPFARKLHITYPNGLIHIIVTIATPISDRTSQIVQFCLRNDTEADAKAEDIIAFDRAVTLEDRAILETTDYDTPLDLTQEQHMISDQPGILMRRKLAALLKQHGEGEQTYLTPKALA